MQVFRRSMLRGAPDDRAPYLETGGLNNLLDVAGYSTLIIGYLVTVVQAHTITPLGFSLLTAGNLAAFWLYHELRGECASGPRVLAITFGLLAAIGLAYSAAWQGMEVDWLLPLVTVGVIGSIYTVPFAVLFCTTAWLETSLVLLALGASHHAMGDAFQGIISLFPAFAFCFLFPRSAREQRMHRERAEKLITQLQAAQSQLQAYADEVEELAVTRERNRMAREIHDTLGHYLTILAVKLETAARLEELGDARLHEELLDARRVASECLVEVRHSVAALRPADPTITSFNDALAHLVAECEATLPEAEIVLDSEGPAHDLAPELRLALYRCVQESLTNIRKHAQATKVLVRVRVDACRAELTVLDNGQGSVSGTDGRGSGFGLLGMRERIALLGGTVQAHPAPGQGWRVEISLPIVAAVARSETTPDAIQAPSVTRVLAE